MSETAITLAEDLRAVMEAKNVGCRQLADMTGLDRRMIQRVRSGKMDPRAGTLEKIVAALERA